ncbi:hypothetical protein LTR85_005498 [Meristemomyces frigidus]|nr:hypothetical protein LTR85_005498 [Meristemomyces frigidus]
MAPKATLLLVPREIRDIIYTNLITGEIIAPPNHDAPGSFIKRRFDLATLSTNRQLHDEAQEYLFKANTFVLVTHKWLAFCSAKGPLQEREIPVITKDYHGATMFKHASLHLDISCDSLTWHYEAADELLETGLREAPPGAFLITLQELANRACKNHVAQINMIMSYAAVTGAFLALRKHDITKARELVAHRQMFCDRVEVALTHTLTLPSDIKVSDPRHTISKRYLDILVSGEWENHTSIADHATALLALHEDASDDVHLAHDLALAQRYQREDGKLVELTERLIASSACALAPRCFHPPTPIDLGPAPQGVTGWSPANLSGTEQSAVHALQDQHGLPRSRFD